MARSVAARIPLFLALVVCSAGPLLADWSGYAVAREDGFGKDVRLHLAGSAAPGVSAPQLHLGCRSGALELFVRFPLALGHQRVPIALVFDDEAPQQARWRLSGNGRAAAPPTTALEPLLLSMLEHERLELVARPGSVHPVHARFELAGLAAEAAPLFDACRPREPQLARHAALIRASLPEFPDTLPRGTKPPRSLPGSSPLATMPSSARRHGVFGTVRLEALVMPDGSVRAVTILDGPDPDAGLGEAAATALRRWRFEPARRRDGVAVPARAVIDFEFGPPR